MSALTAIKYHSTKADGSDNAGGLLYTYAAGTTTPQATYTTAARTTPNANPVVLDSTGRASVWLDPALAYKFAAVDADGVAVPDGTVDNWLAEPTSTLAAELASTVGGKGSALIGYMPGEIGAIGRTAQSKLREIVSIADFGGLTTNTAAQNAAALQAAVNSLAAGGEVVIPRGDWLCGTVYIQNDRVNIRGEGDATIIISGNDDGLVFGVVGTSLSFCEVTGIRFDRVSKSTSGAAVKMIETTYSKVENCKFRNSFIGVHVKGENDSLRVVGNHFYDGTHYGVYEYNDNELWSNDLMIRDNYFWHVEQAGVFLGGNGIGPSSIGDTYIDDNVFVSSVSKGSLQTQYAIHAVGVGSYNTNISVTRNTFEGIRLQSVFMPGLNRCRVANNYFSGTDTNDVGLYFGGGVGNSVITGNIFVGFNNPGAFIYNTGGITISGNNFTSNATLGGSNAELVLRNVQDTQVVGNYFYSSSSRYCIDITQDGSTVDFLTITDNRFAKFAGNTNYVYDIRHNHFGGNRVLRNNLGNDATSGKAAAAPIAGMALQWYPGEKIENTTASELGTAGSKYVVEGWVNVTAGDPGTWVQRRSLTGN